MAQAQELTKDQQDSKVALGWRRPEDFIGWSVGGAEEKDKSEVEEMGENRNGLDGECRVTSCSIYHHSPRPSSSSYSENQFLRQKREL